MSKFLGSSDVAASAGVSAALTGTAGRYVGVTNGAPGYSSPQTGDFANDPTTQCFWEYNGTTWQQVGASASGAQAGDIKITGAINISTGWFLCDGTAYSRTTYATLFSAITIQQNGTTTISANTVTGLTDTSKMAVGMPLSGTGIAGGAVIASISSGTAITMSVNATASGTVAIVVAPYGVGDGSTTFNVPDYRGRSPLGAGTGTSLTARVLGVKGGEENHALTGAENGSHSHTDSGHTHSDTGHAHGNTSTQSANHVHQLSTSAGGAVGSSYTIVGGAGGTNTLSNNVSHVHSVPSASAAISSNSANISTTAASNAHNTMHPYQVCNYAIKN